MKKNCESVVRAWQWDEPDGKAGGSIWTDGRVIWSYRTPLVVPLPIGEPGQPIWVFNMTRYSTTTSTHQNAIQDVLDGVGRVEVEGIERGASVEEVQQAGIEKRKELTRAR